MAWTIVVVLSPTPHMSERSSSTTSAVVERPDHQPLCCYDFLVVHPQVNDNGVLSFDASQSDFWPISFPVTKSGAYVFWSDVLRENGIGRLYYRVVTGT